MAVVAGVIVVALAAALSGAWASASLHGTSRGGTRVARPAPSQALSATHISWAAVTAPPLLPGETLWSGVPSYLFGTNDTQNWDPQHSFETEPAIAQELKADHFPFIRTWFFQHSLINGAPVSDAEQLARVNAVQQAGMTCLGELPTKNTLAYDEHIVQLLGNRCTLYEFMNEPSIEGYTAAAYLAVWNADIPHLRAINPQAKFGGPATYDDQGNDCTFTPLGSTCFMQKFLIGAAASGVLPDFVTFHWYGCWQDSAASCLAKAGSSAGAVRQVRDWVNQYLGARGPSIPIGVTEWNVDPSAPMPSYTQNASWLEQFSTTALEGMARGGASFADQFDLANAGGYNTDDMVDIYKNGAPKPQYIAMRALIASVYP